MFWSTQRKRQMVLNMLRENGEMIGFEMIIRAPGVLRRGTIDLLLDEMVKDGLICYRDIDRIGRRAYRLL